MFGINRVFVQNDAKTGLSGWFFNAREGLFGPYPSREMAVKSLGEFVKQRIRENDDGGRLTGRSPLSLKPLDGQSAYNPLMEKAGTGDAWQDIGKRYR